MTIITKFELFEPVKIKPLEDLKGKVVGVWISSKDIIEYKVAYFFNGDRKEAYLTDDELDDKI